MSDDARILELLEEALSSQVTPEEVCADNLELPRAARVLRWTCATTSPDS